MHATIYVACCGGNVQKFSKADGVSVSTRSGSGEMRALRRNGNTPKAYQLRFRNYILQCGIQKAMQPLKSINNG
jgi:hypothetical protein